MYINLILKMAPIVYCDWFLPIGLLGWSGFVVTIMSVCCATLWSDLCVTSDLDPVTFDLNINFDLDSVTFALEIFYVAEGYSSTRYVSSWYIHLYSTDTANGY